MAKFTTLQSHMVPLLVDDIDTDQIIPARFLKTTSRDGLADVLFSDWRYLEGGADNPDFILNKASSKGAQVLLAGANFGSGSSREHAPWSLCAWGFRAVIARSFADIFRNNALKNGLLPIQVEDAVHDKIVSAVQADASAKVSVDLETQKLTLPSGDTVQFPVDTFAKHCLLNGVDQLGYIQSFESQISEFEAKRSA